MKSLKENKKGISLIVLVVTIVVIIILVATVLYNITDGKIFGVANESVFKNDLRVIEEEFEMFVQTKATQSVGKFEIESLNAADNGLTYNTKTNEKEKDIYDVIPTAKKGYYSEFEIIKGELYYKGDVEQKLIWAKELGIGIIPYEIVDGVLISANSNLLLLDSTGTIRIPYNVEEIASGVFNNLEGLTRVIIPGSVKKIGDNAFSNNKSLQEVIIEDGVEVIGKSSFYNCSNLVSVIMPDSITRMDTDCFGYCYKLKTINLSESLSYFGVRAFSNCSSLEEIFLPNYLQNLGGDCFSGCTSLKYIKFNSALKYLGTGIFKWCSSLNNIDTSENNNFVFNGNALYSKDYKTLYSVTGNISSLEVNENTETIRTGAMQGMTNLKKIFIPKSVNAIGSAAFGLHKYESLIVDSENQYFTSLDNDLYSKNFEILYRCNKTDNVIVKEGVKQIIEGSFLNGVISIELPESLRSISQWGVIPSSVKYLYIPKNVTDISSSALIYVKEVEVSEDNAVYKSIDNKYLVDKSVKKLYWVGKNISNISDLPESIETVEGYSFYGCTNLKEVILKEGIKNIADNAFYSCNSINRLEIPNTIENIGSAAFINTNNLTEIIIHKKRGEIAGEPWSAVYGTRVIQYDE